MSGLKSSYKHLLFPYVSKSHKPQYIPRAAISSGFYSYHFFSYFTDIQIWAKTIYPKVNSGKRHNYSLLHLEGRRSVHTWLLEGKIPRFAAQGFIITPALY